MTYKTKLWSTLSVSLLVLAACDGSDGAMGNPQEQFGNLFANAFNASPDADPKDDPDLVITFGGVEGVDLGGDPLDI